MNHKTRRRLIDFLTLTLARIRIGCTRNILNIIKSSEITKLNIGSGLRVAAGWINMDASLSAFFSKWPDRFLGALYRFTGAHQYYSCETYKSILSRNVFIHANVEKGIPFPSESIDFVYSCHFVEHLSREAGRVLVNEIWRVLKKGGTVRIVVPDLSYVIDLYKKGQVEYMLDHYLFMSDDYGYMGKHKYMYDFGLLQKILVSAGFADIRRCEHSQGIVPDIQILDHYSEQSLYVEATKPKSV